MLLYHTQQLFDKRPNLWSRRERSLYPESVITRTAWLTWRMETRLSVTFTGCGIDSSASWSSATLLCHPLSSYLSWLHSCIYLEVDDSPRETEGKDDAQSRAFVALWWKFLFLHNLSLVQIIFTLSIWRIPPRIWLFSPIIPKFKWGSNLTHRALTWCQTLRHTKRTARKQRNAIANTK